MAIALASELTAVLVVHELNLGTSWLEAVVDGVMLCALLFPAFYLVVVRPMVEYLAERERAEAELIEREERFRSTFEQAAVGVTHVAPDGSWLRVNQKFCDMLGFTHDELLRRSFRDITYPDDLPLDVEIMHRLFAGELRAHSREKRYVKKDGSIVWVNRTASVAHTAAGDPAYIISILEDITDRKIAEVALRESEEHIRELVGSAPEAVVSMDAEGRVMDWNPEAERMFGWKADDARGRFVADLIVPPSAREPHRQGLKRFLETGEGPVLGTSINIEAARADGTEFPVELSISTMTRGEKHLFVAFIRDQTERRRLEDEMNQFFDLVPDLVCIVSPDGMLKKVNGAWESTLGYTKEELLARPFAEFIHPGDVDATSAAVARQVAGGSTADFANRYRCKDGSYRWLDWRATLAVDGLLFAAARDITERRKTQAALRESEGRFQRLVENATDLIYRYELGPNRGFSFVSPAATAMTGYSPDDHYGDPDLGFKLIHPDDRALLEAFSAGDIQPGQSTTMRWIRKDGELVWTEQRNVPIFDSAGNVVAIEGIARDVTERKRDEDALRESEMKYRSLVETAQELVWKCDDQARFTYLSPAWEKTHGYKVEEMLGKSFGDFERPEVWARDMLEFGRCMAGGSVKEHETTHIARDGTELTLLFNAVPLRNASGEIVGTQGTATDITERKRLAAEREHIDAQLRQAQKLEAVGQLAAGVAHDFNNKLGVILLAADMAMSSLDPSNDARADIEEIRAAALRSADLTRQLLGFARMQPISPRSLDLNDTVASMLGMLRRLAGEGVDLVWAPEPNPCWVNVDPGQVDQVLVNLAVNARDAVLGSGTIAIATKSVSLDEAFCATHPGATPGHYVVLEVTDNGHGMDQETMARIFEPFFTTKPQGKGTGLGLATVYGIAHQNHGFVDVESEPELGTAIRFFLPAEAERPANEDARILETTPVDLGTVLLVEDEPALFRLTTKMLERLGATVLATQNPIDAIRLATEHASGIDLLVTDVVMPGMNGVQLVEQLRKLRPGLRCLFVSGYPASVLADAGVLGEGVDLLPKPYSEESFRRKLREVLGRQ